MTNVSSFGIRNAIKLYMDKTRNKPKQKNAMKSSYFLFIRDPLKWKKKSGQRNTRNNKIKKYTMKTLK